MAIGHDRFKVKRDAAAFLKLSNTLLTILFETKLLSLMCVLKNDFLILIKDEMKAGKLRYA